MRLGIRIGDWGFSIGPWGLGIGHWNLALGLGWGIEIGDWELGRGRPILFNRLFLTDTDTDLFSITDTDI